MRRPARPRCSRSSSSPRILTDGLPKKIRQMVARVQRTLPRFLVMRVLMVGCAVGEGQVASSEPWAVQALHEALRVVARQCARFDHRLQGLPLAAPGGAQPFSPMTATAACRACRPRRWTWHYNDFEDYMQRRLGKVFRKNLRRKFRASEAIGRPEMTVLRGCLRDHRRGLPAL